MNSTRHHPKARSAAPAALWRGMAAVVVSAQARLARGVHSLEGMSSKISQGGPG